MLLCNVANVSNGVGFDQLQSHVFSKVTPLYGDNVALSHAVKITVC